MKYTFVTVLISLLVMASCKKEGIDPIPCVTIVQNETDTILPSDYLMTYPGSWWEYSNGQIDSCLSWENVVINSISTFSEDCEYVYQEVQTLPFCTFGLFSNDSRIFLNSDDEIKRTQHIVSAQVGQIDSYQSSSGSGTQNYQELSSSTEVMEILSSMTVAGVTYNDVIHTEELNSYYFPFGPGTVNQTNTYYYAKDVGVIKKTIQPLGTLNSDTLELVNHFIAPH